MVEYPSFEIIEEVPEVTTSKELTIKPRRWWQFSDARRINRKLHRLRSGGILHFVSGVYVINRTLG